jgi:hypothetical protein
MKIGELVRHKTKSEWGVGVVVSGGGGDKRCRINFEGRKQAILELPIAEQWLEPVDAIEIAADSPLLDPKRWVELEPAPDRRSEKQDGTAAVPQ